MRMYCAFVPHSEGMYCTFVPYSLRFAPTAILSFTMRMYCTFSSPFWRLRSVSIYLVLEVVVCTCPYQQKSTPHFIIWEMSWLSWPMYCTFIPHSEDWGLLHLSPTTNICWYVRAHLHTYVCHGVQLILHVSLLELLYWISDAVYEPV
jgi:hypothetical protein